MNLFVKNGSTFTFSTDHEIEGWTRIVIAANTRPIVISLCDEIMLVKYEGRDDGVLIVFPYRKATTPRVMKLHNLPTTVKPRELLHAVFRILLDFDEGRLSNRMRNSTLIIVRYFLPDVIRGMVGHNSEGLRFYIFQNKISLYKGTATVLKLDHFSLLSYKVKESLS